MHHWRIGLYAAIAGFWLVMMALLVRDHVLPSKSDSDLFEVSTALISQEWEDYEEWMALKLQGQTRGASFTTVRKQPSGMGYLAGNRIQLDLRSYGLADPFWLETVAMLDPQFNLQRAKATVRFLDSEMLFLAIITNKKMRYRWQLDDRVRIGTQSLDGPISLLEAVRPLVTQRLELKVGKTYRLPVLDSTWSLHRGLAQMRVEAVDRLLIDGKSVPAYRVVVQLGTLPSTTWVSPKGEVLRRQFANIAMERIDPDEARERFEGIGAPLEPPRVTRSEFQLPGGEEAGPEQEVSPLSLLFELLRQSAQPDAR